MNLIVMTPFNGYETGTTITDEKEKQTILGSEWAQYVVKVPSNPAPSTSTTE